jgi:hypothetical protein
VRWKQIQKTTYSILKHFTGFTRAALIACDATVSHAIINEINPAAIKYQASRST